ncbi:MAG: electron transport complex subunit E [Zetaproteobacteria bacterium]|nr:MAG: electron transport complex subunit E [Zetaproteobacteria bacterium]
MNRMDIVREGIWRNNTIFVQLLGMCPLLGVTTSAENGLWMGLATMLVLLGSNLVVSMIRGVIPVHVRIPCYITIIAAFVTIVDMAMNAWMHETYLVLGLFIPLIVVNCAIMGRAEGFASKNGPVESAIDALSVGGGFTLALVLLGGVREFLGKGEIFGLQVIGNYTDMLMFVLPPGAFIALGLMLAGINVLNRRFEQRRTVEMETARERA